MTNQLEHQVTRFSLSLEELALSLGLINRPDLASNLLNSIYDELSPEEVSLRLSTASHSLMARGMAGLSSHGQATLVRELETAVFPLAHFDYLLHVGIVQLDVLTNTTVHVVKGRFFTSHFTAMGLVHVLEHGASKLLPDFLFDVFKSLNIGSTNGTAKEKLKLHLDILGQSLDENTDPDQIANLLCTEGWPPSQAAALVEDLAHQTFRSTLMRVEIDGDSPAEAAKDAPASSLLVLKGPTRTWMFVFSSVKGNPVGSAYIVDPKEFRKKLGTFVA